MSNIEILNIVIGLLTGGGLVSVFTIPALIKKAKAEARAAEIENVKQAVETWKEISNERQEEIGELKKELEEKDSKIDSLYLVNSEWRDKYNEKCAVITDLKVKMATNEVKLCKRRGCAQREPQSGY